MYNLNKITAVVVGAIISLIDSTEYKPESELYNECNNIIGYKNNKIIIANECLIRLYSVVPESKNTNASGICEITTASKSGAVTGSMIIRVEVDDLGYGFKSPTVSFSSETIIDNISDNSEAIIAALKTIIK